jgi:hypothetical protein
MKISGKQDIQEHVTNSITEGDKRQRCVAGKKTEEEKSE